LYNPKPLADLLDIPPQNLSRQLKGWSVYDLKAMLLRVMIIQAGEHRTPVLVKSAATRSRAGMTLSVDTSVMDRLGKRVRGTWSWESGRCHAVMRGQDVLGLVWTIKHTAGPLHLVFCAQQGRDNTTKAAVLLSMWSRVQAALHRHGMDRTTSPLTMDSWFVSQSLRHRLHELGCTQSIMAGKSPDTFLMDGKKQEASPWKQELVRPNPTWGMDVPACRVHAQRPTCGALILVFFQKSTTRSSYWMNFRQASMRGAAIWHLWQQHHRIACVWQIRTSIFPMRSMQWQGDGLYTALLIKV
jgi:hypothetical protein